MARKSSNIGRGRYGGLMIEVEGLEEYSDAINRISREGLRRAIRASLRGAGGEALASEMRAKSPKRSGGLVAGISVHAVAGDDVLVGYQGGVAKTSLIVGAREQRGVWVESGVKPHTIQPKQKRSGRLNLRGKFEETSVTQKRQALSIDGGVYSAAYHPGYRGRKVAQKSMRSAEWEVLADIADKITEELGE